MRFGVVAGTARGAGHITTSTVIPGKSVGVVCRITSQAAPLIPIGGTYQTTFELLDEDGNPVTPVTVSHLTSNAAVFTVSAGGLVTATGAGTATHRVVCDGVVATETITGASPNPVPDLITINPASITGYNGQQFQVAAVPTQGGQVVPGRTIVWSTTDATKATVSADSGDDNHTATVTLHTTLGSDTLVATDPNA